MENQLIVHAGAQVVPFEALLHLPEPKVLGPRHYPVPHHLLVQSVRDESVRRGWPIDREEFAVTTDGSKLFALFQYEGQHDGRSKALGLRNATDQSIAIRGVGGAKVFICDNMALSGDEFLFAHKNTTGLVGRLIDMVKDGFGKFTAASDRFEARVKVLQEKPINQAASEAAIYRAFAVHKIAALRLLPEVHEAYFEKGLKEKEYPEVEANVWGLHNAFTRVFKGLPPAPKFQATRRLGQVLGL